MQKHRFSRVGAKKARHRYDKRYVSEQICAEASCSPSISPDGCGALASEDAQVVDERGTKPVRNRTAFSIAN